MSRKFDELLDRLGRIEALLMRLVVEAEKPLPSLDGMLEATKKMALELHQEVEQQHQLERWTEEHHGHPVS